MWKPELVRGWAAWPPLNPFFAVMETAAGPLVGVGELGRIERLRGPPDPGDRRRVGFHVTAKGTELVLTMKRSRTDWLAPRLAELPPEARSAIRAALPALEGLAP